MQGTQQGEFLNISNHSGIGIFQIVDGKITAAWLEFDQVGLLQELGVILVCGQLAEG
jgi:hypothetical protein